MSFAPDRRSGDYIQPFQIEGAGVRGRLVRLGAAVDGMLDRHAYPPVVAALLAEAMAMTAVLASSLKFDGVFTLQVHGGGPVRLLVTDVTSDGSMRGYARFDDDDLAIMTGVPAAPVPKLLGAGHMAFTVDQGPHTERYQGITPLEGHTLADCAHTYFRQSEQLETALALCASDMVMPPGERRAAALMIQRLPAGPGSAGPPDEAAEDSWRRAVVLMSSVTPAELLEPQLDPTDLLYRLFHEDGVRIFRPRPLRHHCRCSRTRVERTLLAFPRAELKDLAVDGVVIVTCEFCKAEYRFDEQAMERLFEPAAARARRP
ncbi:MAG: molecular chaperone Hsp33 [Rhodospirillales bacterium]|nr:MAG: molecular chaperone Hsp33 [Rhodospirillales bacterium]